MADFDKIFPYCEMKEVEVDGQKLIQIPRFYIRNEVLNDGVAYAGKYAAQISDREKTGFHIHPAFVKNGAVLSCIQYGAYEASMAGYPNGDHYDSSGKTKVISNFRKQNWSALAKNWHHSVFYQLDLADAAEQFERLNIPLPPALPVTPAKQEVSRAVSTCITSMRFMPLLI